MNIPIIMAMIIKQLGSSSIEPQLITTIILN